MASTCSTGTGCFAQPDVGFRVGSSATGFNSHSHFSRWRYQQSLLGWRCLAPFSFCYGHCNIQFNLGKSWWFPPSRDCSFLSLKLNLFTSVVRRVRPVNFLPSSSLSFLPTYFTTLPLFGPHFLLHHLRATTPSFCHTTTKTMARYSLIPIFAAASLLLRTASATLDPIVIKVRPLPTP